ncbi:hypothetical protein ACSLBF_03800 [Pseudoalteromonas sp. T1lg65]|uniref:hypothetical protein n=1 Tax=Pseudoalteromonas sp. T1lg65 TaxID=2077101 RepID=UPI003F79EDBF
MNALYAEILDVLPLRLNSHFSHLAAEPVNKSEEAAILLTLPQALQQDLELALGHPIEVHQAANVMLEGNTLYLPTSSLSTELKRELWALIWSHHHD